MGRPEPAHLVTLKTHPGPVLLMGYLWLDPTRFINGPSITRPDPPIAHPQFQVIQIKNSLENISKSQNFDRQRETRH